MSRSGSWRRRLAVGGSALILVAAAVPARAQDSFDRVLNLAEVVDSEQCAVLHIGFNLPVHLVSSFPQESGDAIHIRVADGSGSLAPAIMQTRESLHPPASILTSITTIDFDGQRPEGPTLDVTFRHPVHFHVGQGTDFRSIVVAISSHADTACTPDFKPMHPAGAGDAGTGALVGPGLRGEIPAPTATANKGFNPQLNDRMKEARAALTAKDYPTAIRLLTAVVDAPESGLTPEALELLGLARERNNQLAHAKAEYEEYLRRYPKGPAADRVRQRLAGVLAVGAQPNAGLRQAGRGNARPGKVTWEVGGSVSEYYYFDEGYLKTDTLQPSTLNTLNSSNQTTQINQNQFLTAIDGIVTARGADYIVRGRVSTTYTEDLLPGAHNVATLSALYLEAMNTNQTLFGRIGRQNRTTGGVLGRFDGGLFSYKVAPQFKLELATGYPVDSYRTLNVATARPFVAASLAMGPFNKAWNGDLYYVYQANHGLIDREAVGGELRYISMNRSLYALVDYDVHFNRVNLALFNATTTFKDKTSVSLALDYRQSPLLTTNDALIGQTVSNVTNLIPIYGASGVYHLAMDRSSDAETATLSVSHPFTDKYSINLDATAARMGATPASGGVPAGPSTGVEEYLSVQGIGTGLLKPGDIDIIGLRFGSTAQYYRYILDLDSRYPISRQLRINPRLIFSYRDNKVTPGTEFSTKPSVRLNYYFHRHYQLEVEGGGEWTIDRTPISRDSTLGFYTDVGIRADF